MKKWNMYIIGTISRHIGTVEAETKEAAEEAAWEHDDCCFYLCHQCESGGGGDVDDVNSVEVEPLEDNG
jgi:hypothetical protein